MDYRRHEKNGIIYFTSPLFERCRIPHFFAARRGGVSRGGGAGDFESLNASLSRKDRSGQRDTAENVLCNLRRVLSVIERDVGDAAMMHQIHSTSVLKIDGHARCTGIIAGAEDAFPSCDGIFIDGKAQAPDTVCVKTADCVPILLYDLKNERACALHAGWRGTTGNICAAAVNELRRCAPDADIVAAIGPCIGACCYEVNDTVYRAALAAGTDAGISSERIEECFPERYTADGEQKYRASLAHLNRLFLAAAGVRTDAIDETALCTACSRDAEGALFFSHRASGGYSGTQWSAVALRRRESF